MAKVSEKILRKAFLYFRSSPDFVNIESIVAASGQYFPEATPDDAVLSYISLRAKEANNRAARSNVDLSDGDISGVVALSHLQSR